MRFDRQVALVTGAGAGIGRATAQRLAKEGARLVMVDIDAARLGAVAGELRDQPNGAVSVVVGDVAEEGTARRAVSAAMTHWGRLDVLVNNAGKNQHVADLEAVTPQDWDHLMATNLKGAYLMCRHAIPQMLAAGHGNVVNVSSISAFVGQEFNGVSTFAYNVTKAGLVQLTRSLASRYARDGVRINAVCPGATRTESLALETPAATAAFWAAVGETHPMGRVAEPEEIAALIAFVASNETAFMTGSSIVIDGGYLVR